MIISFLSSFSQRKYPLQTMFKGDSVVILRYDQAIEVNNLLSKKNSIINESDLSIKKLDQQVFTLDKKIFNLKDTIKNLKWKLNVTHEDLSRKLSNKTDSLTITKDSLEKANSRIVFYQGEMKRIEKLEWIDKRTRTQVKIGLVGVIVTWTVFGILSIYK